MRVGPGAAATVWRFVTWIAIGAIVGATFAGCGTTARASERPTTEPPATSSPFGDATPTGSTGLPAATPAGSGSDSLVRAPAISCSSGALTETGFLACQYSDGGDGTMPFYLYIPHDLAIATEVPVREQFPLVLLLHGSGETAEPNRTVAENRNALLSQPYVDVWGPGYPAGGPSVQDRWPSVVVVPQLTDPQVWVETNYGAAEHSLPAEPSPPLQMAIDIVSLLEQQYPQIDPHRVYTAGVSLGGFGVWDAIERWPHLFAAAVPISGAGDPAFAARIAHLPIWAFHGSNDPVVPVEGSRLMIAAVRAAGGSPCYTEYAGEGHVVWNQAFALDGNLANPLYPWLFAQIQGAAPAWSAACG